MDSQADSFEKNVFINCPFDKDYYIPLLRPLIFTIVYLGYNPRIASESFDTGEGRIQKISNLVRESKFSIHDLSRIQAKKRHEIFRLNMAFELGIDIGCRLFKEGREKNKKCLVLEAVQHRIKKALSDLSGSDIKHHNNNPEEIVRQVRNWFVENGLRNVPSTAKIWETFNKFMAKFYQQREEEGFKTRDLEMMPIPEFIDFIKDWFKNQEKR
ncbi:MAG: hypothetical protein KAW12_14905 [Candidatus Aminicenantes bacterium]|nr:hypothetical protein [Candidatus Aminicenantes bacterium]